jgi:hypothetical protein
MLVKTMFTSRHLWFTPVILATQEAEIRRIVVRSQPWQIVLQDSISKSPSQKKSFGKAQGEGPEFKHQYHKNKKRQERKKKFTGEDQKTGLIMA